MTVCLIVDVFIFPSPFPLPFCFSPPVNLWRPSLFHLTLFSPGQNDKNVTLFPFDPGLLSSLPFFFCPPFPSFLVIFLIQICLCFSILTFLVMLSPSASLLTRLILFTPSLFFFFQLFPSLDQLLLDYVIPFFPPRPRPPFWTFQLLFISFLSYPLF